MVVPDVNVLVAASRADHPHHSVAMTWLSTVLIDSELGGGIGVLPVVASGYLRLVTHPRVFVEPTPLQLAVKSLDDLLAQPGVVMTDMGIEEWRLCRQLCLDKNLQANDIPDALIAAATRLLGAKLVSFDRGFAAFMTAAELQILS